MRLGEAEFVARMGTDGIVRHQLLGHLLRQAGLEPPTDIDGCQFPLLCGRILLEFRPFARQVGILGVRLRIDRDVFTSRHRHGPGHQPRDTGHQNVAVTRAGSRDTDHEAGRRHQAVVGAQHRGAQPAYALGAMTFRVAAQRSHGRWSWWIGPEDGNSSNRTQENNNDCN